MRIIEGLDDLNALQLGSLEGRSTACIGVFDGVHLGHQRLLHELREYASELGGTPTVVTFRDHPDALLRGTAPPLITSVPHRLRLLRRAGVDRVALLDFDARLRSMTAEQFARDILHSALRCNGLLLGYDSALGKDRAGTPERLQTLGQDLDFAVRVAQSFSFDGGAISSTRIRDAIASGDLPLARRLLGRWPSILGQVIRGDQRGRTLGFPTANVAPESTVLPPNGVYACEVLRNHETLPAIANLGVRPTFRQADAQRTPEAPQPLLEVHLLEFDGDLYGTTLEVSFLAHLRAEQRFASSNELQRQIEQDLTAARTALANRR